MKLFLQWQRSNLVQRNELSSLLFDMIDVKLSCAEKYAQKDFVTISLKNYDLIICFSMHLSYFVKILLYDHLVDDNCCSQSFNEHLLKVQRVPKNDHG